MSIADQRQVSIMPIISYPREAQAGKSYIMTIDLRVTTNYHDWPFPEEEYPIWFILNVAPLFNYEPLGDSNPAVIIHRFGGTYGPATFLLSATQEEITGKLYITLINDYGIPIDEIILESKIISADTEKSEPLTVGYRPTSQTRDSGQNQRPESSRQQETLKDFFISYTSADRTWAEWIAWQLEEAQYSTILQAWDFRPGMNFVLQMEKASNFARCTLLVLSPDYLNNQYTYAEWAEAFKRDPNSEQGAVLPVRVQQCEVEGLLGQIIYIDLVDLDEAAAREALLSGVRRERGKPETAPGFPGREQPTFPQSKRFPGALPALWNVPYPRNQYFTGRDVILQQLSEALKSSNTVAISGLGGIGKTQCAVEYAYRSHPNYQAVLWVLAETRESLTTGFVVVAGFLNLPQRDAQDLDEVVEAVKLWLQEHGDWLLILDHADELAMVSAYLPPVARGHVLLTTRAQAMARIAKRIELAQMEPEEGALFLLRRAGILRERDLLEQASAAEVTTAQAISQELDGLPLALDQAGAYIEETGCGLAAYLDLFHQRGAELLGQRSGLVTDHPEPVATTWSLSFEKVEQANAAAAELLRLCAFLAPDAIPEEIIIQGASELGPILQPVATDQYMLNAAIAALQKYSLVKRDTAMKTLSIHRLVQAVIRDGMDQIAQRRQAEYAMRAVNAVLPAAEHDNWAAWERFVANAQACAQQIERYSIQLPEANELLQLTGWYLTERARYAEAEPLLEQAYALSERVQGPEHLDTARDAITLASLYQAQGRYAEAEPLLMRALSIEEKQLGPEHPDTAQSLNNLGLLYDTQGRYAEAEPLFQRALSIREQQLGPEHPYTAQSLNNLASLYQAQGRYAEAEPLLMRALSIEEKQLGPEHPYTAQSLNKLASLYQAQGKYAEAEPLFQRALAVYTKAFGPKHPVTQTIQRNYELFLQEHRKQS
jgi:tetratricopeptide (TPR) repeat protein